MCVCVCPLMKYWKVKLVYSFDLLLVIQSVAFLQWEQNVGCWAVVWIWMWAAAKTRTFALRSVLHPHPPRSEPSVSLMACWLFGRLGLELGTRTGTRTAGSALPQSLPVSCLATLQFPAVSSVPCYLCHGNCARLPAQTQIPPHLSPFASMMTQQLLQGFQSPPSSSSSLPHWYTMLIRQSSFLSPFLLFVLLLIPKHFKMLKSSNRTLKTLPRINSRR